MRVLPSAVRGLVLFLSLCIASSLTAQSMGVQGAAEGAEPPVVKADSIWVPENLSLHGLEFFSLKDFRKRLQCGSRQAVDEFQLHLQDIAQYAASFGYLSLELDAQLDSTHSQLLALVIHEGLPSYFGEVVIDGLPESLNRIESLWPVGKPLHEEAFAQALETLLEAFDRDSRPFAMLEWTRMEWQQEQGSLHLTLRCRVKNADRLTLDAVYFPGRRVNLKSTLASLSRLSAGQTYDPKRLRDARRRLLYRDWFHSVGEARLCNSQDGCGVLLPVDEKPAYYFDGNLAYLPPAQGDDTGRLAYDFVLDLNSLLGTGRELHVLAARPDGSSQNLRLAYREPFVAQLPLGLGIAIDQNLHDSTWVVRQLEGMVDYEPRGGLFLKAAIRLREVLPDSLNGYIQLGLDHSISRSIYLAVEADTRDQILNPRRGYFASLEREEQTRSVRALGDLPARGDKARLVREELHLKAWFQVSAPWIAYMHLAAGRLDAVAPTLDELFALGGVSGPRAYRDGFFRAYGWGLSQVELRFMLAQRARVSLFWDALRYESKDALHLKHGRGVSLLLPAGKQVLEFQMALAPGTPLREAYIHMRWVARF
jgi:outer membrane protein assembly factor BamA